MKYVPTIRQASIFSEPYRYIIDACSIISQNPNGTYSRDVNIGLWNEIDALVKRREIVTCKQIADEVLSGKRSDPAKEWVESSGICVLVEDEFVQRKVREVVNRTPHLLRFKTTRNSSSGDAFIIATAIDYGLTIITEEKRSSPIKIPQVAERFGVKSLSIMGLAQSAGWTFD